MASLNMFITDQAESKTKKQGFPGGIQIFCERAKLSQDTTTIKEDDDYDDDTNATPPTRSHTISNTATIEAVNALKQSNKTNLENGKEFEDKKPRACPTKTPINISAEDQKGKVIDATPKAIDSTKVPPNEYQQNRKKPPSTTTAGVAEVNEKVALRLAPALDTTAVGTVMTARSKPSRPTTKTGPDLLRFASDRIPSTHQRNCMVATAASLSSNTTSNACPFPLGATKPGAVAVSMEGIEDSDSENLPSEVLEKCKSTIVTAKLVNQEEMEKQILKKRGDEIREQMIQDTIVATRVSTVSDRTIWKGNVKGCTVLGSIIILILIIVLTITVPNRNKDGPSTVKTVLPTAAPTISPFNIFLARVPETICFERTPGQGRSPVCNINATVGRGGGVVSLVSQIFLERVPQADIVITNSGVCKTDIEKGNWTLGHGNEMMPYNNELLLLIMAGSEIKIVLEEAMDAILPTSLFEDPITGAYPYRAGLRYGVDLNQPSESRVFNLETKDRISGDWSSLELEREYKVVVNDFIYGGGDNYFYLQQKTNATSTGFETKDTVFEYAEKLGVLVAPAIDDYSTSTFVPIQT